MYVHLKMANEEAQKELISLKNKLFEYERNGPSPVKTEHSSPTKNDIRQKILLANEDLAIDSPVDL